MKKYKSIEKVMATKPVRFDGRYLGAYFTTYTVLGTLFCLTVDGIPEGWVDVVRGMAMIVAVSMVYVYIRYGPNVVHGFYQKVSPDVFRDTDRWIFYDLLLHFAPVIVLGLPHTPLGIGWAYALFLSWFLLLRSTLGLQTLYSTAISEEAYDLWAFVYLPMVSLLWAIGGTSESQKK